MAPGVRTSCMSNFPPSIAQKWKFCITFLDIHNDEISYVKHVLYPLYVVMWSCGGLGDGVDGEACCAALRVASTEQEASLLRGLLVGALWTAARVRGHNMWATSSCPGCGSQYEDESETTCGRQPERAGALAACRRRSSCSWAPRHAGRHACGARACSP